MAMLSLMLLSALVASAFGQDVCTTPECIIASGDILENVDLSADPCVDFYQFSCGNLVDNGVIPAGSSKIGTFYDLIDDVTAQVEVAITAPVDGGDSQSTANMKNHYQACLDRAAIDAEGYSAYVDIFVNDAFGGWPMAQENYDDSAYSWEEVVGSNSRYYLSDSIISFSVYLDTFNTARNILTINQPFLAMPSTVYENPNAFASSVTAYKDFIIGTADIVARAAGQAVDVSVLAAAADDVFDLESTIASLRVPLTELGDVYDQYNIETVGSLKQKWGEINWDNYLNRLFEDTGVSISDSDEVIVPEPAYFDNLVPNLAALDQVTVANYLYTKRMITLAGEGPQDIRDEYYNFYGVVLGLSEPSDRAAECNQKVQGEIKGFAYAVGAEYVDANFDESLRADANDLVNDLREAFKDLVDESSWMSSNTQPVAKDKADNIVQLIGYPDFVASPSELDNYYGQYPTIDTGKHFENVVGVIAASSQKSLAALGPSDRTEWITSPQVVNAFYSPDHNSISFPAGIVQPPFFGKGYPRYLNYGAMGVVMGHEITHGFDNNGRNYDATGNLFDWWDPSDSDAFDARAQCFVDQYDTYVEPTSGLNVNGQLTLGENIADNGGVREAYKAYLKSVAALGTEPTLPGLEQYTIEQLFFIGYAQVWCEKGTPAAFANQISGDVHSPGRFRVIGPLSNSDDFIAAFQCPPGSPMNRGDEKCVLW